MLAAQGLTLNTLTAKYGRLGRQLCSQLKDWHFTLWLPSTAGWEDSCSRSSRIDTKQFRGLLWKRNSSLDPQQKIPGCTRHTWCSNCVAPLQIFHWWDPQLMCMKHMTHMVRWLCWSTLQPFHQWEAPWWEERFNSTRLRMHRSLCIYPVCRCSMKEIHSEKAREWKAHATHCSTLLTSMQWASVRILGSARSVLAVLVHFVIGISL